MLTRLLLTDMLNIKNIDLNIICYCTFSIIIGKTTEEIIALAIIIIL